MSTDLERIHLGKLANGGETWEGRNCECDAENNAAPCRYCAIHDALTIGVIAVTNLLQFETANKELTHQLSEARKERDEAKQMIATIRRMADIAEAVYDAQSEQEAAHSATFNEAMALDVYDLTQNECDKLKADLTTARERIAELEAALNYMVRAAEHEFKMNGVTACLHKSMLHAKHYCPTPRSPASPEGK